MTEDQIIQRARRVARLLAEDDVAQAFADIEADVFREWQSARDERERESLHSVHRATQRLRAKLQSWADELIKRDID